MCGGDRVNCNSQLRLTAKSLFACAHEKANNAHVMSKNSDLWARRSSFSHPTVVRVDDVASYVVYSWLFSPTLLNKTVTAVNALVARHFREAKIIPNYLGYLKEQSRFTLELLHLAVSDLTCSMWKRTEAHSPNR